MTIQQQPAGANATQSEGENVSELESLALRAAGLNQSVDWWNTAMVWALVAAAIVAIAVVVSTRLALVRTKQLSDVQDRISTIKESEAKTEQDRLGRELATAEARAKEADARISEATAKAKAAEAQVASAKAASDDAVAKVAAADARSAEASAKAEGFRLDIAKANERAADANRIAE
jgi:hypothetical protein